MNLSALIKKGITKLGSSPDPIFTIVALCTFNMTLRPLITLSDKKQPKSKRIYAAMREFATELIALPTCVIFARGTAGFMAKKFARPENIKSVKNVFSLLGLVAANFLIPIITTKTLHPAMKRLNLTEDKIRCESLNPKTSLNTVVNNNQTIYKSIPINNLRQPGFKISSQPYNNMRI